MTFAEYWTHPDPFEAMRRKSAKCAEVLVPDDVESRFITRAYVSCSESKEAFEALGIDIPVSINSHLSPDPCQYSELRWNYGQGDCT
jgi:hypothetical protein